MKRWLSVLLALLPLCFACAAGRCRLRYPCGKAHEMKGLLRRNMIRPLKPTEFDSFYSLLEASLPPDEFRARDDQRRALDDPAFCPYVLVDAQEAVRGLVTVWDFDGFAFIEHLAVAPELRCGGHAAAARRRRKCRPLPLLLMTSGGAAPREVLDRIRDTVYARVYRRWS